MSNQLKAQHGTTVIDTLIATKNKYLVDSYSGYFDLRGIKDGKLNGVTITKDTKYYSYTIKNLSNKIDTWALYKKYMPWKYAMYQITPGYNLSHESGLLVGSWFIKTLGEEKIKKSFLPKENVRDYITFKVIYDLDGKVAEVTSIEFATLQPVKFDIKDVEKMEEIIKTYANFVPNVTSAKSKELLEIYPKINYFNSEFYFNLRPLIENSSQEQTSPKRIEIPKFNTYKKQN